jgi:hypothetical protein
MTAIGLSFVIALALNGAFFAVAAARKTDVVTDLSYSLTFALSRSSSYSRVGDRRFNSSRRCSSSSGRCAWGRICFGASCGSGARNA